MWSVPLVLAALLVCSGGQEGEAGSFDKHAENASLANAKAAIAQLNEFVHKAERHLTEGSRAVVLDILEKAGDDLRERRRHLLHEWIRRLAALDPAELAGENATTVQHAIDAAEGAEEDLRLVDGAERDAVLAASTESCRKAKGRVLELGQQAKQSLDGARKFAERAALREQASGVPKSTFELENSDLGPRSLEWKARQVSRRAERLVEDGCQQVREQLRSHLELLEHEASRAHRERQASLREALRSLSSSGVALPSLRAEAPGEDPPSFSWLTRAPSRSVTSPPAGRVWGYMLLLPLGALLGWTGYAGVERALSVVDQPALLSQPAALG